MSSPSLEQTRNLLRIGLEPDESLLLEFTTLADPHHTIIVREFLLGQYRIQLTDKRQPEWGTPPGHGAIVQQCCTYQLPRMIQAVGLLRLSADPLACARGWARPWNCEYPGGRIRLDNEPPAESEAAS